jgi:hypothetical protein
VECIPCVCSASAQQKSPLNSCLLRIQSHICANTHPLRPCYACCVGQDGLGGPSEVFWSTGPEAVAVAGQAAGLPNGATGGGSSREVRCPLFVAGWMGRIAGSAPVCGLQLPMGDLTRVAGGGGAQGVDLFGDAAGASDALLDAVGEAWGVSEPPPAADWKSDSWLAGGGARPWAL